LLQGVAKNGSRPSAFGFNRKVCSARDWRQRRMRVLRDLVKIPDTAESSKVWILPQCTIGSENRRAVATAPGFDDVLAQSGVQWLDEVVRRQGWGELVEPLRRVEYGTQHLHLFELDRLS
jgi:hypothetical protein